MIFWQTVVFW